MGVKRTNRQYFNMFYQTLPIYAPTNVDNESYNKFYAHVYRGNTHNLSLLNRAILALIHRPLWIYKANKSIRNLLREQGPEVERDYNISIADQRKELRRLAFSKKVPPEYYYTHQPFKNKEIVLADSYVLNHHAASIHSRLLARNENRDNLNSKIKFFKHCRESRDIIIPIIAIMQEGKVILMDEYQKLPDIDFFIKPVNGNHGRGCFAIRLKDGMYHVKNYNKPLHKRGMVMYLKQMGKREPYILQPLYKTVDGLQDLTTGGLLISRTISYIDTDGVIKILLSFLQLPMGGEDVSNNGVFASMDLDTGVLNKGYRVKGFRDLKEVHPDTGAQIEGRAVPMWEDAKQACIDMHRHFMDIPCVAWDVAYTTEGIKVIEGNLTWSVEVAELIDPNFDIQHYIDLMNYHIDQYDQIVK